MSGNPMTNSCLISVFWDGSILILLNILLFMAVYVSFLRSDVH